MLDLNDESFLLFCAKYYDSPNMVLSEMEEDLRRVKYVKRLIKKYKTTGDLKTRLILNHIVILTNVFGVEGAVRILFFKVDPKHYDVLKTFLLFLNIVPKLVFGIKGKTINTADITVDLEVIKRLREI